MKGLRWRDCKTDEQKWQWHAEVYACRRLVLGEWGFTSPADPDGKWFDKTLVDAATERMRPLSACGATRPRSMQQ